MIVYLILSDCDKIFRLGRIAKLSPNLRFLVGWAEYGWPYSVLIEVIAEFSVVISARWFLGAVLLLICGPIIVFCNFSISLVWIAKLSFTLFVFFWDGLPSSAPITQAELGSSILAKFSYVVPHLSRVACQVF